MHPETTYTVSVVINQIAEELGMTPLELIRQWMVKEDTLQQDKGTPMTSYGLAKAINTAAEFVGFEQKWHPPGAKTLPDGRKHGIGIVAGNDRHGICAPGFGSIIMMNPDGTAYFNSGMSNNQLGCNTVTFACIIAETIGLRFEDVSCAVYGSVDSAAVARVQAGSSGGTTNGSAHHMAALDCRKQMLDWTANELGVEPEELDAKDGKIFVKADPTQFMTHAEVMSQIPKPIIGVGRSYDAYLRYPRQGFPVGTYCSRDGHRSGFACCYEVAVDTETGEVEILNSLI